MDYKRKIKFHLPGAFMHFKLYSVLFKMKDVYPQYFRNIEFGSVYGSPGGIWNGGRSIIDVYNKQELEMIKDVYNNTYNVPVRFTFTNCLLTEKHLTDAYCNMIVSVFNNYDNEILCNRDVLEEYLRKNYTYKYVLSTTRRITDIDSFNQESDKYDIIVADIDINNTDAIKLLKNKEKVEFLCNEACYENCPKRLEHYRELSRMQLNYDNHTDFHCENESKSLETAKLRRHYISPEKINEYIDYGFQHFKLQGRTLSDIELTNVLVFYLIKDEYQREAETYILSNILMNNQGGY